MKTVNLILPLEATAVSDSRSDRSSDSVAIAGATAVSTEQQKRQQSDSRATTEQYWSDIGVTAEPHQRNSRATAEAIAGGTAYQQQERKQWCNSGAIAVQQRSDNRATSVE